MSTPTMSTHAAITTRKRDTNVQRCRGCGHGIRKASLRTTVRWWDRRYNWPRLQTDVYHAECTPAWEAGETRVVLLQAGYQWDEYNGFDGTAKLVPCQPDRVVDTVTREPVAHHLGRRFGFMAVAAKHGDDVLCWKATTRGSGTGSTRHTWYATEAEARHHLVKWYRRRYRYADERLPA